jgi:putative endonuclease
MYYTYVLQSEMDSGFYVGFTKDLKLRPAQLNQHLMNKQGILSNPKKMLLLNSRQTIYLSEGCLNQADAIKREKYLKT